MLAMPSCSTRASPAGNSAVVETVKKHAETTAMPCSGRVQAASILILYYWSESLQTGLQELSSQSSHTLDTSLTDRQIITIITASLQNHGSQAVWP